MTLSVFEIDSDGCMRVQGWPLNMTCTLLVICLACSSLAWALLDVEEREKENMYAVLKLILYLYYIIRLFNEEENRSKRTGRERDRVREKK